MKVFEGKMDELRSLCKTHNVKSLFAFGSAVRDDMIADSDIDLIVDLNDQDPYSYTDHYFSLSEQLHKLFKRPVDLLELRGLKNPVIREEIDRTKVLIYG